MSESSVSPEHHIPPRSSGYQRKDFMGILCKRVGLFTAAVTRISGYQRKDFMGILCQRVGLFTRHRMSRALRWKSHTPRTHHRTKPEPPPPSAVMLQGKSSQTRTLDSGSQTAKRLGQRPAWRRQAVPRQMWAARNLRCHRCPARLTCQTRTQRRGGPGRVCSPCSLRAFSADERPHHQRSTTLLQRTGDCGCGSHPREVEMRGGASPSCAVRVRSDIENPEAGLFSDSKPKRNDQRQRKDGSCPGRRCGGEGGYLRLGETDSH